MKSSTRTAIKLALLGDISTVMKVTGLSAKSDCSSVVTVRPR